MQQLQPSSQQAWPQKKLDWAPAFRIISTRFPSIYLFDRVADADDFDALYAIEAMTNPRIRDENGDVSLVPAGERIYGQGAGVIMAAFTHLNPDGSRFSDGSYGVFYAAKEKDTAVAETKHHAANFMRATNQAPTYLQMRVFHVKVKGQVSNLFSARESQPEVYALNSYAESQTVGKAVRDSGALGLCYPSVRRANGICVAAFKTALLSNCVHAAYLEYHWDGNEINYVTERIE